MSKTKPEGESHIKRINTWITRLEHTAATLLEDIDIEELTQKERLDIALKCMGHIQRYVALGQQIEVSKPEGAENTFMEALRRQMRGELIAAPGMSGEADED